MDNKTYTMSMLLDFFGDLLTDKQREYMHLYYNEDFSLSEIAEDAGISRQGVRDAIHRAEQALLEYEQKTSVLSRFQEMQVKIEELETKAEMIAELTDGRAHDLAAEMSEKLKELKG